MVLDVCAVLCHFAELKASCFLSFSQPEPPSQVSGELLCNYYHRRWGVDVRSLRYVGVITILSEPGTNVSDFALAMPRAALGYSSKPSQQQQRQQQPEEEHKEAPKRAYECYLDADTAMSWIYMPDCVEATIALAEAPPERVSVRTGYNVQGCSFSPAVLAREIQKHVPDFTVKYHREVCLVRGFSLCVFASVCRKEKGEKRDMSFVCKRVV